MDDTSIGRRIKEARQEKNLTQKQLASLLGVATGTIQQYELGKRQPRYEQLIAIADALDIGFFKLLDPDIETTLNSAIEQQIHKEHNSIVEAIKAEWGITGSFVIVEVKDDKDEKIHHLLGSVARLNQEGFQKASIYIDDLAGNPKYQRKASESEPGAEEPPIKGHAPGEKEKPPESE